MPDTANCCKCLPSVFGTSSSDFSACCKCNRCNIYRCCDQRGFICEKNYTILRKICSKIFRDFIRSKCREKCMIFEAGNGINVTIHRSGSRAAEIAQRHEKSSQNYSLRGEQSKIDSMTKNKPQMYRQRAEKNASTRNKLSENGDAVMKNNKRKMKRAENGSDKNDKIATETVTRKVKEKSNQRRATTKSGINSKTRRKSTKRHTITKTDSDESYSTVGMQGNHFRKDVESKSKQSEKGELKSDTQDKKMKNIMQKPGFPDDLKAKEKNGRSLEKDKMGSLNVRDDKDDNGKFQKERQSKGNSLIINDLRMKVRRGEKIAFDSESKKMKSFLNECSKRIKHSRADEVKACDVLRAQMEERDFCTLCCQLKSTPCVTYACKSKMCIPNFTPKHSGLCKY